MSFYATVFSTAMGSGGAELFPLPSACGQSIFLGKPHCSKKVRSRAVRRECVSSRLEAGIIALN